MPVLGSPSVAASTGRVSVKSYGAKGDGISRADAATTNGSAVVTSAAGTFTAADVGKLFRVYNGGTTHATTIASRQSATQVTLAVAVPFTGTGRYYTYGTDDTAAITSAIAALGTAGVDYSKTLYFPASTGAYLDTTTRSFSTSDNYAVVGDCGKVWPRTDEHPPILPSEWRYVADDSSTFISARFAVGFRMQGMAIRCEGQSYTGILLDLSATGAGASSFSSVIDTCYFSDVRSNQGGAVGVDVRGAVLTSFRDCTWEFLAQQVQAVNGSAVWSNVVTFTDCAWYRAQGAGGRAINVPYSAGVIPKQWLFSGCTFEPTYGGAAPILLDQALGVSFHGCGWWDSAVTANGGIEQASASGTIRGLSVHGSHFEMGNAAWRAFGFKTISGLSVVGCEFAGAGTVFKSGMTATNFQYQANSHDTTTDNSGVTGGSLST